MIRAIRASTLSECMEIMSAEAETYEKQGGKNLIFCEDRLTLIAERALLTRMGGTFHSSVSTFARFLKTEGKTISKQGSVMAVGEVMARLQREKKLQCFRAVAGIGNARSIYETLAQMSASEVTPKTLRESLEKLPEDILKRKIADLAEIYEGYTDFLYSNAYLDESEYLTLLPKRIRQEGSLKGYNVFFLCYTSFTAQAREAIRAAAETADNVVGIFCGGTQEIYTNRAYLAFKEACQSFGVQSLDKGTPLFGEAERLRKGLFDPIKKGGPECTDNVRIFEAEDRIAESEYVAAKIRREMSENKELRYRDFAVLVPNIAVYTLPLKKTFSEYGIPFIIDEKKSLKRHPLSAFLLSCFRAVRERYSPASVQALTQNVFFGESDEYRNYLLKFANYRGGATRPIKTGESVEKLFKNREILEDGRRRVLAATEGIAKESNGRAYCLAVRNILKVFNVEERLKSFSSTLEDVSHKGYLSQIFGALEGVLREAELLTADKKMSVAEFEGVLQDGLDATEISLIPMKADAVFIGDITDSRIEKVNVLFAMGMTDEVPRSSGDTAIVSDKEIERLAEVKAQLEPTVAEVNLRNRECACLNLCTFLNKLYLSYPLGTDGEEPTTSDVFRYIDRVFCGKDGKKLSRDKEYEPQDFAYQCSAAAPAIRRLLIEKGEYEGKHKDDNRQYSSLDVALTRLGVREKDDYLDLKDTLDIEYIKDGEGLFFHDGRISPTSLEGYFACPFGHFVERGLKLKEREETTVLAVDSGNFVHELLQITVPKTPEFETEEALRKYAFEVGSALMKKSVYSMQQDTGSGAYFSEKLLKEGVDVAAAAYRQVKNSDYSVEKTEYGVASDFFRGNVDRVDGTEKYVRVIDYKTGRIDDSATAYYTGRKLQMQLYMSELKGERIPAGVFYFPAAVDYSDGEEGRFQMKGFLNGDEDALRAGDKNITEESKSEYFPAALKNGPQTKRVMDESTFRDFLDYAVFVARQGVAEIKEGYIAPTPYEGKCKYCKYGGMCGFRKEVAKPRSEKAIDPKTLAEIARKKRDGDEE